MVGPVQPVVRRAEHGQRRRPSTSRHRAGHVLPGRHAGQGAEPLAVGAGGGEDLLGVAVVGEERPHRRGRRRRRRRGSRRPGTRCRPAARRRRTLRRRRRRRARPRTRARLPHLSANRTAWLSRYRLNSRPDVAGADPGGLLRAGQDDHPGRRADGLDPGQLGGDLLVDGLVLGLEVHLELLHDQQQHRAGPGTAGRGPVPR